MLSPLSVLPEKASSTQHQDTVQQRAALNLFLSHLVGTNGSEQANANTLTPLACFVLAIVLQEHQPNLLLTNEEKAAIVAFVTLYGNPTNIDNTSVPEKLIANAAAQLAVRDTLTKTKQTYKAIGYLIMFGYACSTLIARVYACLHLREQNDHWLARANPSEFTAAITGLSVCAFVSNMIYTSKSGAILFTLLPQLRPLLALIMPKCLRPKWRTMESLSKINKVTLFISMIACAFIGQGNGFTAYLAAKELFNTDNFFCHYLIYPYLAITSCVGETLIDFLCTLQAFDAELRKNLFKHHHIKSKLNYITLPVFLALNLIGIGVFTIPPFIIATRKNHGIISIPGLLSALLGFAGGLGVGMVAAVKMNYRCHSFVAAIMQVIQSTIANCSLRRHFYPLSENTQPKLVETRRRFLQSLYHALRAMEGPNGPMASSPR